MSNDSKKNQIQTSVLPGFMELIPAEQIVFDRMKDTIRSVFESFGFAPMDTPAIERAEVLVAKAGGETEKQIYEFKKGDNDLALRFDLTVPLARFVAENFRDLAFPFRRYQIGKVYRGESPQKGRYREFYQCDIDIIGNGELSLINDAEMPAVIFAVFSKLNIGKFQIRISNRKLINGLMVSLGLQDISVEVMRIIDKMDKVGKSEVSKTLLDAGVSKDSVEKVLNFTEITGDNDEVISALKNLNIKNETFEQGINELEELVSNIRKLGVREDSFVIDLTIARGLDYYTGTVYETRLVDYPKLGSICSGGRFDNLAEKFTEQKLPGVGISIGLTRLFSQLKEAGVINFGPATLSKVLVIPLSDDIAPALSIASDLRKSGIATEIYLEEAKMKSKLSYADKIKVPYVVLVGDDEIKSGKYSVKNMNTGEQVEVPIEQIKTVIK